MNLGHDISNARTRLTAGAGRVNLSHFGFSSGNGIGFLKCLLKSRKDMLGYLTRHLWQVTYFAWPSYDFHSDGNMQLKNTSP